MTEWTLAPNVALLADGGRCVVVFVQSDHEPQILSGLSGQVLASVDQRPGSVLEIAKGFAALFKNEPTGEELEPHLRALARAGLLSSTQR